MIHGFIERVRTYLARRRRMGARGERAAAKLLKAGGYRLRAKNLRNRFGEIDLLAESPDGKTIVIVEVKTARSEDPPPEVHVTRDKQRKLAGLAQQVVRRFKLHDRPVRFDVVGVVWVEGEREPRRITHHIGAFESLW